ncbi:MAG: family 1 glycosylhydrolase, partial [Bacteroidota bacterium]
MDSAYSFPPHFRFGTSTSAAQIESAVGHDWEGFRAIDGSVFSGTTRHEQNLDEDLDIIRTLAPNYRMSLMWSRLQLQPFAPLDPDAVAHYHRLFRGLQERNVSVMLVLHHFANPTWFAAMGGWSSSRAVDAFLDYVDKILDEFGAYPDSFNTFN